MSFDEFVNLVSKIKNIELPAESSHFKMVPPSRKAFAQYSQTQLQHAKYAGVMALFYPNTNFEAQLVLILRNTYKGVHSAQISFPGGKKEKADPDLKATAIRETFEEIGVPTHQVEIVKQLTQVYIPPSNFYVQPYMGILHKTPNFVRQESEVEQIIEVKLTELLNDNNLINETVTTSYSVGIEVPAFNLKGFTVWGATAMMLSEIKDIIKQLT